MCAKVNNTIECSLLENESFKYISAEKYGKASVGFWLMCIFGTIGLVNNILVLIIFHRLKWFREKKMILFWNLAIVDLLTCLVAVTEYSVFLSKVYSRDADIQKQKTCVETMLSMYSFCTTSSTFALAIAIDRLVSKWWPYHWIRCEKQFRWTAVICVWIWGFGHEIGFIVSTPSDTCVLVCLGTASFAQSSWNTFVTIVNNIMSGLILIIYVVLPCLVSMRLQMCFTQITTSGVILNYDKLQRQQHEFIQRLRIMSALFVSCYLVSTTPAYATCDVILLFYDPSDEMTIIFSFVCNICLLLNSVFPVYLWLFDTAFRKELYLVFIKNMCKFNVSSVKFVKKVWTS